MAAEAWSSIFWTAFTLAPAEIARLAVVWRRSCGTSRSRSGRSSSIFVVAGPKQRAQKFLFRIGPPSVVTDEVALGLALAPRVTLNT